MVDFVLETEYLPELEKSVSKGKAIALFYASWCPDCATFMPVFEKYNLPKNITAIKAKIDEDENPIWDAYQIEVVPTVVYFVDGKEKARCEERSRGECASCMQKLLKQL